MTDPHSQPSRVAPVLAALVVLLEATVALAGEGEGSFYFGDLGQAVAAVLIFLLLLAILGRWAWKPIVAQIKQREDSIAETLKRSEQRDKETHRLLEEYRARMETADAEAQKMLAQARRDALEAGQTVLTAAENESRRFVASAREEIEQAKRSALRELRASTAELASDLAAAVIGRTLTREDHLRLVDESMAEIVRRGGESD
jgi:F-type H+-transporting ATPase subunit b